ncbi:MAG: VWA domain-containing protein [Thermoanaerobaculia bacterium]
MGLALVAVVFAAEGTPAAPPVVAPTPATPAAELPKRFSDWLEEVAVLINESERQAFLSLSKDYQRDAFIDRFWRERDPYPETGRNELRERWKERVDMARTRFGKLTDLRAEVLLLNGPPTLWKQFHCRASLFPLELWFYGQGSERMREPFLLLFLKRGSGYMIWQPIDGFDELVDFDRSAACDPSDSRLLNSGIAFLRQQSEFDYANLAERVQRGPEPASREWVATFNTYSTDLPSDASTFPAELSLEFPGWYQNRTVVQGILSVPAGAVTRAELEGHRSYNLLLTGEVLAGETLFDSFRYRFDLPAGEDVSAPLPLAFQRYLRPGSGYRLVLKAEDLNSGRFFRTEEPLVVPVVSGPQLPPAADPRLAQLFAEANRALAAGENSVHLVPPIGELLTGLVRFDTLITGEAVRSVTFNLNNEQTFTKNRPPYSVELDLGSFPRVHTLIATALDENGQELASDELQINVTGNRFRVRLLEPQRGKSYQKSLRARVEVELPKGDTLDRVELYLDENKVATLYQPPFVQPLALPAGATPRYVRAVAYRTDGSFAEDLVFLNAGDFAEELDVQFVELFTSVLDRQGRPVAGLEQRDFRVREDGTDQDIRRFEQVRDLPIHALILLDTSASMVDKLDAARAAALQFFKQTIGAKDQAGIVLFNDRPYLASPFTSQVSVFAGGLTGIKAERGTSLYDSLIYSLFYFSGIRGQKALVLLSDGKDETSRFNYAQALEYVRRAGVTLYPVAIGLTRKDGEGRKNLERLAEETGGRSFFLDSADQLPEAYQDIQTELRSQYLLAYQSKNLSRGRGFRSVDVEVSRQGLEAKTLRGYYP